MKKTILLISILSLNIFPAEYKVEINNANYDQSISVETYIPDSLNCVLPLVINEAQTACEENLTCAAPLVLNDEENACIEPIAAVGWIVTDQDTCNGMKQSNFNENIYYSRANTNIRNMNLEIPKGYRWITKLDYMTLYTASTVLNKTGDFRHYRYQCGLGNYPMSNSQHQYGLLFKNDPNGMHSSHSEYIGTVNNSYNYPSNFLGYVLYKD